MSSISTKEEYEIVKNKYLQTIKMSSEWEYSLEKKYNEDQELDIISLVSYFDNKLRGFGRYNDEQLYNSICDADVDGQLSEEAKIGFEFSKICFQLRKVIKKWDNELQLRAH